MKRKLKVLPLLIVLIVLFQFILPGIEPVQASTIHLSTQSVTLKAGATKTLYVIGTANKVTWYPSNRAIAAVTTSGKVTAKAPGTTTIYAYVSGKKLACKITVVKLSASMLTLETGSSKTLKVYGTTGIVTWSSNNSLVAAVSSGGRLTARTSGTAAVTASVAGIKLICNITVKKQTLTPTPAPTKAVQAPSPVVSLTPSPEAAVPSTEPAATPKQQSGSSAKIVGYYAAWSRYSGFTPDKIDANKLTHINYAFANIGSDLKIALGYPDIDAANISQLNSLKNINPNLKTIISVGGWTWSGRFSDAALTDASRSAFADSCVSFLLKYGFDGIDIDWEYPVSGGLSTNVRRPEDKYNFTLLMKTLREKLDARGSIDGKKYILSFAGAAGKWYLNNVQLSALSQYADYSNLMTYDIHGSWDTYTAFNAPLYSSSSPLLPDRTSVNSSILAWLNAGFPKEQIVMGVPFYGYIYKAVPNINNGLYQTYSGTASISYVNITANYLNAAGYTRFFDPESMVPWLYNGSTFISYEDEQSMTVKARYIVDKGLGGAMIWELSQDPNEVLLNALNNGL